MKKFYVLFLIVVCLFVMSGIGSAETLYSKVITSFNSAVSTTSTVGVVISNAVPKSRIKHITISWAVTTSTASIILYDNNRGTNSTEIYRIYIASGTVAPNYIKQDYDMALPKMADYGLIVVCDNNSLLVAVTIEYW